MGTTHSIAHSGMALFGTPIQSTIGGLVIDLASAPIEPGDHELRIEAGIGGIEIYLPRHVKFVVDGGSAIGGQDVHEGHGLLNTIGRKLGGLVGWHSPIPDEAVPSPDPTKPTTIRLVIEGVIGGIDIYRL